MSGEAMMITRKIVPPPWKDDEAQLPPAAPLQA